MSGYYTYEDSVAITDKLAHDTAAEVTMKKEVILGKNANVDFIVKKGDKVEVGSPLMIFENSYDDQGVNALLRQVGKDLGEKISEMGKSVIKSKYSGIVEDVKIYYTVNDDELSPSLKKIINDYNGKINKTKKLISKYIDPNETSIILPPSEKVEPVNGKVKGIDLIDQILIEFYVKYEDITGIGDKLIFQTALKGVACEVIPKGFEPYSEFRPEEEISAFLSPISVN